MMRLRRPAYMLPGLAILAFATFLTLALVRLFLVEQDLRDNVDENMLWVISQAQVASHRLDGAVNRHLLGGPDADPELHFDILVSLLVLLDAGPQRRYLEEIGLADGLNRALLHLEAMEPLLADLESIPQATGVALHAHLEPLMAQLNRIANAVMVQEWEATGTRLDAHRRSMLQAIASILGILLSGLLLVALLNPRPSSAPRSPASPDGASRPAGGGGRAPHLPVPEDRRGPRPGVEAGTGRQRVLSQLCRHGLTSVPHPPGGDRLGAAAPDSTPCRHGAGAPSDSLPPAP